MMKQMSNMKANSDISENNKLIVTQSRLEKRMLDATRLHMVFLEMPLATFMVD